MDAGTCYLGGCIYLFGGIGGGWLCSIEKLDLANIAARWQFIEPTFEEMESPPQTPVMAVLNSTQIVIFGGHAEVEMNYLFDTETQKFQEVEIEGTDQIT